MFMPMSSFSVENRSDWKFNLIFWVIMKMNECFLKTLPFWDIHMNHSEPIILWSINISMEDIVPWNMVFAFKMGPKCVDRSNKYELFDDTQNVSKTIYFTQVNFDTCESHLNPNTEVHITCSKHIYRWWSLFQCWISWSDAMIGESIECVFIHFST